MSTEPHWANELPQWHGYPVEPGADTDRPWWRPWTVLGPLGGRLSGGFVRPDGRTVRHGRNEDHEMARVDREHPLAAPPPRCGQVWRWPQESIERTLLGRGHTANVPEQLSWVGPPGVDGPAPWPPPSAVLVAGPFSPWASMGEP